MLKLTLLPDEYLTVNGDIVVQLLRVAGGRADVAVEAPREMPIVRGAVLERSGGQRPACLAPPPKKKPRYYRDQVFRWNDDRERAVRAMKRVFDRLEEQGSVEEAKVLRTQLDRIIPAFWEDDLAER
ncbi:MAG: carbon storage regulator [Lawsonibacter sp.]|jgi:sRNA-binding carbon storage regulator CsrA|nr:carbon storage regulator [Lawsonibacter sp.]